MRVETADRRAGIAFAVVFVLALALRAAYLWQMARAPLAALTLGDAQAYDAWAVGIAAGDWVGTGVFYQAPLYPYFLAAIYAGLGHDLLIVRLVQVGLGALACALLAGAGRGFFDSRPAGWAAGCLLGLYAPAIFFDALLQKTALDSFLLCGLLYLLGRSPRAPGPAVAALAGVLLGLVGLTRENSLVFAPVLLAWLACGPSRETAPSRAARAVAFILGLALVLGPVALRNRLAGGELQLTTFQLGTNLYIGNHAGADGTYVPLRWGRGSPEFERADAVELAEAAAGRRLEPAEVSRYWTGQALAWVRAAPGDWLALLARKWLLVWNAAELGDTEDPYSYADASPLLRLLLVLLHFGVLCPLAVFGMAATASRLARTWVLHAMLLTYASSVAAFFVLGRYRFPLVPILALFAGAGLVEVATLARRREPARLGRCVVPALAAAVLCNLPLVSVSRMRATTQYNVGTGLAALGRGAEAIGHYREALRLEPDLPAALFNLGNALAKQGDPRSAIEAFREAVRRKPDFAEAWNNLGGAERAAGQLEAAVASYSRAIGERTDYAEAHNNLGLVLHDLGRAAEAIRHYDEARRLTPDSVATLNNLSWILATTEDPLLRDPTRAVALAERACGLGGGPARPVLLGPLPAAYAGAGRFDEAVVRAREARELALAAGQEDLVAETSRRLALYAAGRPYRQPEPRP